MKNISIEAAIKWVAFAFAINFLNSYLWNSMKGFILVNIGSAVLLGLAAQYYTSKIIERKKRQHKVIITVTASILLCGLSFGLNFAMFIKLMSTTIGHSKDLWWFLF